MSSTDHLSELESLRSQVTDLSRALAERDQSMSTQRHQLEAEMQDLREQSHLLHTIIKGIATETGEEFLASLVTHLTSTLHVQYAVIGEVCEGQPKKIRTLAVSAGGTLVDNFEYELAHTPCATALTQTFARFDCDVQGAFPQFQCLADLGAESYCAVPLQAKGGATIGLLAVMDTKALQQGDDLQSLLGVLAPRVAAEFERRRAEQERTQALADLHNVMETIPDVMFTLDTQGNIVKWNRRVVDVTGYSPEELLNMSALVFVPPEEQARTASAIQRAFMEGYAELEGHLLTKEHRLIPYHWTGALLKNPQGEPIGITGIGRDVSEKKRAEEALRKTELRYRTIFEQAGAGVAQVDSRTGRFVHVNRSYCEIVGLTESEMLSTTVEAITHPDDSEENVESRTRLLSGEISSFMMEKRYVRKDGFIVWVSLNVSPLWQPGEAPVHHIAIVQDITERKRVEEALRESEERLALAVAGSTDILWDAHRLIGEPWYAPQTPIWWSPRVRELLGLEESEPFETLEQWAVRLHPDDKDRVFGQLAAHIEHRVPYDVEYRLRTNRGDYLWIRGRGQAMWDEQGAPRRMSGSCQDITERKINEQLLAAEKHVLEMIATDTPLQEVLARICRAFEEYSNGAFCSILLLDRDGLHLRHGAAPSLPEAYVHAIDGVAIGPAVGSCGTAAFMQRQVIVLDIDHDPLWADFRDLAHCHGLRACWSTPVISAGGTVLGTFAVYYGEPQQPGCADLQLIERMVDVACIAIERKRTEEALREKQSQLAEAQRLAKIGSWSWTVETDTVIWSDELYALFGRDPSLPAVSYQDHPKIYTVDSYARLDEAVTRALATGERYELELEFIHADGTYRWGIARGEPIWGDEGQVIRLHGTFQDITERKQAEEALRCSERQLRTVLDALPVGVWFTDQLGKPVLSNPAAKQIWSDIKRVGIETVADAAGWWETMGPSSQLHRWALSQSLTKGIPSLNETLDIECLDGTRKAIRNTTVPVRDEAGVIVGALVINEDMTALREAQEAIKLTQFSIDHAVEGFFWIGPDARILNVNDAACRMLEYTRDELTTMTLHDIDPNLLPELWSAQWEELKRKGSMTFESKYWSKTGCVLDTGVTVNYLDYEGSEYSCVIVRDIRERKRTDAALRASEGRYRTLYDDTPTMYFTLATDGMVRSVNRFGADQLGYLVEELIGHSVLDIFHEDDKITVAASLTECLTTPEKVSNWEFRKVRRDGGIIWVRETASVGRSSTGETIVLVTCSDITDRKCVEETLRQREIDLRVAVEDRERISQDLHDGVLQSLFAVGLTLETATLMMPPRSRKTFGQPIGQAIDQLNRVMHEIRNFIAGLGSDLLKGKDLPTALRYMLELLGQTQGTRVRLVLEDRATQALSTEQSLHLLLIIQEAVGNCIKHGHAQEATVSLKMLKQGVRLSIRDNGCGFNPKATRRTGYGLSNMTARAQKIGGRFTLMSKVNKGTRIVLDLPKEVSGVC